MFLSKKNFSIIFLKLFFIPACFCQPVIQEWIAYPAPQNYYRILVAENQLYVDATGNVYVGGNFSDTVTFYDSWGIAKINAAGSIQWTAIEAGMGFSPNYLATIAIDNNQNLYATGSLNGSGFFKKAQTNKYDPNGNLMWSKSLDTTGGMGTAGHGNYISVNNECYELVRNQNITLRRYDANGNVNLMFTNDTVTANPLHAFLINGFKMDSDDNIYVYGSYVDTPNLSERKFFVKKFTSTGGFIWQAFYNPTGASDNPNDLFIDSLHNVYLTGEINSGTVASYGTVVYDSTGAQKWQATFQYNGDTFADDIVADKSGNVYVNGWGFDSVPKPVCHLLKYDTAGNIIWQRVLDSARVQTYAKVKLDDDTNVYVSYSNIDTMGNLYVTTAKYDSSGSLKWKIYYNPGGQVDALVIDSLKNVYIAGSGFVVKYSQITAINEITNSNISAKIYPNPNNGNFSITYLLPQNKSGILEIFDVNGRKVYSQNLPPWSTLEMIKLPELSGGLYNCIVTSGNSRVLKKVAVINE